MLGRHLMPKSGLRTSALQWKQIIIKMHLEDVLFMTQSRCLFRVKSWWIIWHINSETGKPEDSLNNFCIYITDIWPLQWNIFTGCSTNSMKWQNMQAMLCTLQTPQHKTFSNLILSAKSVTSHCLSITAARLQPDPSQYHRTISHWLKCCLGDIRRIHISKIQRERD